ncbi:hypothetical protein ASPVEDRAFT_739757 [Aspergillus versicolor CBS 583.65]|uniref:Uncharacterized protein n=1 Tax=Aspergillus versicolor CBS 583.65 TaxID=1036611 RepID=A0A1L9PPW8_ASPVE|nr:uncharacterized protein ASPVEDRAFT_739757 [Aspergillus versicolor CBS 583.65]OJJ03569.1 hypothetical protein ASPVEDRAFT_739757 [Aspergillus versicolor CBS 583.65]
MRDIVEDATDNGVHCPFIPTEYGPISISRDAGAVYARPSSGSLFERSRAYSIYALLESRLKERWGRLEPLTGKRMTQPPPTGALVSHNPHHPPPLVGVSPTGASD